MSPLDRDAAALVPPWPVVQLVLDSSGRATVDGADLDVPDGEDAQAALLAEATRRAHDLGRPLRVRAVDPAGTFRLVAHPDGSVDELPDDDLPDDPSDDDRLDDRLDDDVPWHLCVHPNGEIVPMDDLGLASDSEPVFRPSSGWTPTPPPDEPVLDEPDDPEPDEPESDEPVAAEPAPDEPASVEQPVVADEDEETEADDPHDDWHDLPDPPPPLLVPDLDDLVHELRATAEPMPAPRPSRRWVPLAIAATVGVLAVGGGLALTRGQAGGAGGTDGAVTAAGPGASASAGATGAPGPTAATSAATGVGAAPPPATTGASATGALPAKLDVAPPPGFTTTPAWGVPVAGETTVTVSADGLVAVLTADRKLALVDPASGAARWRASTPPQAFGPYLSRIDDRRALAMLTTSELLYWPLPDGGLPAADATAPVEIALPAGSTVTWAGPSPLVTLGDGSVAVVRGRAVQRVNLPSGMRALAADGGEVIAVSGRNWVRQGAGSPPATPKELAVPDGASGTAPARVENVGGDFLGAMWAGPNGPVVAVHDAHTGAKLAQATFPENVDFTAAPTVRENGTDRTTVGSALFDPANRNLSILKSPFTPVLLTPGHVYASDASGAMADLRIAGKDLTTVRFTGRNPVVPAGVVSAGGRSLALVAVPNGNGWVLAALPSA